MPTVLVMWEHGCAYSPIWSRGPDLEIGNLDARGLGLDDALREDLADWNHRVETTADPGDLLDRTPTAAEARGREVEAFSLPAPVQRRHGDGWTVPRRSEFSRESGED